ncbi:GNAT family N-acetyltransferase [Streptomyces sp. NPDC101151]|uniref:GNAT family N-acetyltransferase n=1 Tax=Streptomyces sp. NPDC101151 TaxID=3366115 RepID=UPI003813308C
MPAVFRTRRLAIRAFTAADAPAAFAMWSDPEVCRYTGDEPAADLSVIVADIARWRKVAARGPGCGFWAVDADGVGFVGDVYVRPFDGIPGEHEIGWHFARPHWGRGYATEAAAAAVGHAHAAGVSRLVAPIDPGHRASLRVAKKAGLLPEGLSGRYAPGEPPSAVFASTVTARPAL